MTEIQNTQTNAKKTFDLEERTFRFAQQISTFLREIFPKIPENDEYLKQLIRSSGSVAANYIEANEAVSKKDFQYRIRVCRKEAKESRLWLKLINIHKNNEYSIIQQQKLVQEALELTKIFTAILKKLKTKI